MRSAAVVCEQWDRNLSFSSADVRGAGTRDTPLRMSAGEAIYGADILCFHVIKIMETFLITCLVGVKRGRGIWTPATQVTFKYSRSSRQHRKGSIRRPEDNLSADFL